MHTPILVYPGVIYFHPKMQKTFNNIEDAGSYFQVEWMWMLARRWMGGIVGSMAWRRQFKIVSDWLDGAVGDDDADRL